MTSALNKIKGVFQEKVKKHAGTSDASEKLQIEIVRAKGDDHAPSLQALAGMGLSSALSGAVGRTLLTGRSDDFLRRHGEYVELLDSLGLTIRLKVAQGVSIAAAIHALAEFEFVKDTGRGPRALTAASRVDRATLRLGKLDQQRSTLLQELRLPSADEHTLEKAESFKVKLIGFLEKDAQLLTDAARTAEDMIVESALKAWVLEHPDKVHGRVKHTLWVVDQALNGLEFAGSTLSQVPEEYAKAAGLVITTVTRVTMIGKVVVDKVVLSADAERQMANYEKEHAGGEILDEHDADPLLMAKRLKRKREAEVDMVLAALSPVVATAADQVPGLGEAWTGLKIAIKAAVTQYLDQRLKLAEEILGVDRKGKSLPIEFLESLGQPFKDNIFAVFSPWRGLAEGAITFIVNKIMEALMEVLPVDPAQIVSGSVLTEKIEAIEQGFRTQYHRVSTPDRPKHDFPRPTADKDGRPVVAILSDISEADGEPYLLVRLDVGDAEPALGRLMLRTLEFDTDTELPHATRILLQFLPERDSRGRAIDEVRLSEGLQQAHDHHAVSQGPAYYVRIGSLWGYLDQRSPHDFHPTKPDDTAFSPWSGRTVRSGSYTEGSAVVKGSWHKPWPDRHYYLFVGPNERHEWAHARDLTARGHSFPIRVVLKDGDGLDPIQL